MPMSVRQVGRWRILQDSSGTAYLQYLVDTDPNCRDCRVLVKMEIPMENFRDGHDLRDLATLLKTIWP